MNQIQVPPKIITIVLYCQSQQKTFNVDLESNTTIGEIGNSVRDSLNCQIDEKIVLYYLDTELQNDSTLEQNEIGKGRKIEIRVQKIQTNIQNNNNNEQNISNDNEPQENISNNELQQNISNDNEPQELTLNILVPEKNKSYVLNIMSNKQVKDLIDICQQQIGLNTTQTVTLYFEQLLLNPLDLRLEQFGLTNNCKLTATIKAIGGL